MCSMLQVTNYRNAVTALVPGTGSAASIESTLNLLFDLNVNHNLGTRLTDVGNIRQALSDLSALHDNSLAAGSLQRLVDNLSA